MPEIKVCHILWDRSDIFTQACLRQHLVDNNYCLDSIYCPIVTRDLDPTLHELLHTPYTHAVIYDVGIMVTNPDGMRAAIHDLCCSDWIIAGHKQEIGISSQLFLINLARWQQVGCAPLIDDHLTLVAGSFCATDIAALTSAMTSCFIWMNPWHESDAFDMHLQSVLQGQTTLENVSDAEQQAYLHRLVSVLTADSDGAIFTFNTGNRLVNINSIPNRDFDVLWGTASGFKLFAEWVVRGADPHVKIRTYDIKSTSLDLWRHVHDHWDGNGFYEFIQAYDADCDSKKYCWGNILGSETPRQASDRQEAELCHFIGGKRELRMRWQEYQQLDHDWLRCDIVDDYGTIIDHMQPNLNHMLWFNNIFSYNPRIRRSGMQYLQAQFVGMVNHMADRIPRCTIHGQLAGDTYCGTAAAVRDQLSLHHRPRYQFDAIRQDRDQSQQGLPFISH